MKVDGLDKRMHGDVFISPNTLKSKRTKTAPATATRVDRRDSANLPEVFVRVDQAAAKIDQKLTIMTKILNQINSEKDDIIRARLARFFNVLKAFIDEALHPTGDLATDRILAGKSVDIHIDNTSITLQGIRIKLEAQHSSLNELSRSPKTEDVHIMMQAIRKAQRDVSQSSERCEKTENQPFFSEGSDNTPFKKNFQPHSINWHIMCTSYYMKNHGTGG